MRRRRRSGGRFRLGITTSFSLFRILLDHSLLNFLLDLLSSSPSEALLTAVDHVEKSVLVRLLLVHFGHRLGQCHHGFLVDHEEEGLAGLDRHSVSDDGAELRDGDVLGHEELGLVERRQFLFLAISLDDDRHFGREPRLDLLRLFETRRKRLPRLERRVQQRRQRRRLDRRQHEGRHHVGGRRSWGRQFGFW